MGTNPKIEEFFLRIVLRASLAGVILVTISDLIFKSDHGMNAIILIIDVLILICVAAALILERIKKHQASVITATVVPLGVLFYAEMYIPDSNTPMIAILAIGFSISILLDGLSKKLIHLGIAIGIGLNFVFQMQNAVHLEKSGRNEIIAFFIAYSIVYCIITYASSALKDKYNTINSELILKNQELEEKGKALEQRNRELIESENQMNEINAHLEQIVEERTNNVKNKNAYLIKYAFANAHHVRGPLARILGLLQLSKLEQPVNYQFILDKIAEQADEIDEVLKTINKELEEGQDIFF